MDDLERRLLFLGLSPEDLTLLADLHPLLETHADDFVGAFYRHLLAFGETRRLLADPAVKDRLMLEQRAYLLSLADGKVDEDYLRRRRKIGEAHDRVGLAPRWYLGAYSLYFALLTPIIGETYRSDPARSDATLAALMKILMLDAQLAMEAYIEKSQRQLEYLNKELAAAGRDLAREVEEQGSELRATERRARAAEELASVATLAAGLAHEIGTPMGVISGHTELLESAVQDERSRGRLATIREQIDRITEIIHALLDAARPRQPVRAPVDLDDVVSRTLSFLDEKFRCRGIEVEREGEKLPPVIGDAEKLQQVFLNLFMNAADAMHEGGRLGVSMVHGEQGIEVRVTDTGTGIADDECERIFEPFYTTKAAGHGNGLGLVVARGIVGDHGGTLTAEPVAGGGACFRMILPDPEDEPAVPA